MNLEHIFEIIYSECHPNTEEYLKSPLDTESKPVVFMEQFEKIYFECNIKPLFEEILREAENTKQSSSEILAQTKTRIKTKLKNLAVQMEFVQFNIENYNKLLGNGVSTPCGFVKLGSNQFLKLKGKDNGGRQNLIWAIRQTLEDPIVVIHNDAPVSTSKLQTQHENLTYAKSFIYNDIAKHRDDINTIRSFVLLYNEDDEKVVISNSPARIQQILDIIKKPNDILYKKK